MQYPQFTALLPHMMHIDYINSNEYSKKENKRQDMIKDINNFDFTFILTPLT